MVEFDRSAFVAKFQEEAGEHLQALNEGVIALEADPGDRALIEQMLRDAHTLKGSGRMVGLIEVSDVAHRLEDVMVAIRDGDLAFSADMSDTFFEALDTIMYLSEHANDTDAEPIETGGVMGRLTALVSGEEPVAAEIEVADPAAASDAVGAPADEQIRVTEMTTFRVRADHVDRLLNLVSEVVIAQIKQERRGADMRGIVARAGLTAKAWSALRERIVEAVPEGDPAERLEAALAEFEEALGEQRKAVFSASSGHADDLSRASTVVDELQHRAMELRMLPVSTVFAQYPRAVRDLARDAGKQVELVIEGAETELDKKVLEEIADPLVHLVRNAIDHGIERPEVREAAGKPATGTITMSARQEGDHIVISVSDDGAGIDPGKIRATAVKRGHTSEAEARSLSDRQATYLIFESGFSTSPIITEMSGRGVGLDVVRRFVVERLKGNLDVDSTPGKGTTLRVRIPLTLAIIRALLVRVGPHLYALPTSSVDQTLRVSTSEVERLEGREVIHRDRRSIPLVRLADVLGVSGAQPGPTLHVAAVGLSGVRLGFVVDGFEGEQQIVIKSLGTHLRNVPNVAGATILGAGDVVLILDVPDLVEQARSRTGLRLHAPAVVPARRGARRVLICEDSFTTRELERSIFEAAGYDVETAVNGHAGLGRLLQGLKVDAVVTDVQMPEMDGFSLARAIKSDPTLCHLPVVIVTSLEREEERAEGIQAGADAYITKSVFNQDTLLDTVERLVR
jgi:two-component system chemotaxis sensor kinase CheA